LEPSRSTRRGVHWIHSSRRSPTRRSSSRSSPGSGPFAAAPGEEPAQPRSLVESPGTFGGGTRMTGGGNPPSGSRPPGLPPRPGGSSATAPPPGPPPPRPPYPLPRPEPVTRGPDRREGGRPAHRPTPPRRLLSQEPRRADRGVASRHPARHG